MRKKRRISFLTQEEVARLLILPDPTTLLGVRDLAILTVLCSTGLHVTELAALNLSDVDFNGQRLIVGGKRGRVVSVAITALAMLTGYLVFLRKVPGAIVNNQAVFLNYKGQRLSHDGVCAIIRWYLAQAGLKAKAGRCLLRHSFAMEACRQGATHGELLRLLGLSSKSTVKIYKVLTRQRRTSS